MVLGRPRACRSCQRGQRAKDPSRQSYDNSGYRICAAGRDWETELKQCAKEIALMRDLGLTIESDETDSSFEPEVTEDHAEDAKPQTA